MMIGPEPIIITFFTSVRFGILNSPVSLLPASGEYPASDANILRRIKPQKTKAVK
jgi:hypothetical protein